MVKSQHRCEVPAEPMRFVLDHLDAIRRRLDAVERDVASTRATLTRHTGRLEALTVDTVERVNAHRRDRADLREVRATIMEADRRLSAIEAAKVRSAS